MHYLARVHWSPEAHALWTRVFAENRQPNVKDARQQTPLFAAANKNEGYGLFGSFCTRGHQLGLHLLVFACFHSFSLCTHCSECVRFLLQQSADPNWRDMDGSTPLHQCVRSNAQVALGVLLECGVDVVRSEHDGTPLELATQLGYKDSKWLDAMECVVRGEIAVRMVLFLVSILCC